MDDSDALDRLRSDQEAPEVDEEIGNYNCSTFVHNNCVGLCPIWAIGLLGNKCSAFMHWHMASQINAYVHV